MKDQTKQDVLRLKNAGGQPPGPPNPSSPWNGGEKKGTIFKTPKQAQFPPPSQPIRRGGEGGLGAPEDALGDVPPAPATRMQNGPGHHPSPPRERGGRPPPAALAAVPARFGSVGAPPAGGDRCRGEDGGGVL